MSTHEVKSWPEYFVMVMQGVKNFELRKNDRDYQVGDTVVLEEFRPGIGTYSGRSIRVTIDYLITDKDSVGVDGLQPGYCIFGFTR